MSSFTEPTPLQSMPFELQSLALAKNYQTWVIDSIHSFLGKRILELGAGIGNMSQHLPARELLYLTEGSQQIYPHLENLIHKRKSRGEAVSGELLDLDSSWVQRFSEMNFDTIVSFNVMEHIEDDAKAFRQQYEILRNSKSTGVKRIVIFVPAHQWLFGSLDSVFSHFRRYGASRIHKIFRDIDPTCKVESQYFNIVGVPGWFIFGKVFKKTEIGTSSIQTFERLIPYIKGLDRFFHQTLKFPLGQSLISVVTIPN